MKVIKARFQVTTPMFLGEAMGKGESPMAATSIRGASVKGALRATYRSLVWSEIRKNTSSDQEALAELHAKEASLFGQAAKTVGGKTIGGQGKFLLRIQNLNQEKMFGDKASWKRNSLGYLLGIGLWKSGKLTRDFINAGSEFILEFAVRNATKQEERELIDTVKLFGLVGSLGSRARKGFGSVAIKSLSILEEGKEVEVFVEPKTQEDYSKLLTDILGKDLVKQVPPLPAYSVHSKIQITSSGNKFENILANYEAKFRDRRELKNSKPNNIKGLANVAVFGLPNARVSGNDVNNVRRSSPLIAHVHQLADGTYLLVNLVMTSLFMPDTLSIKTRNSSVSELDKKVDWKILYDLLDEFDGREKIYG